jgi:hypothetical protein
MTSVLISGAGASCPAGYPTAQELLPRVREEASGSASVQFQEGWKRWEAFLEATTTYTEGCLLLLES